MSDYVGDMYENRSKKSIELRLSLLEHAVVNLIKLSADRINHPELLSWELYNEAIENLKKIQKQLKEDV